MQIKTYKYTIEDIKEKGSIFLNDYLAKGNGKVICPHCRSGAKEHRTAQTVKFDSGVCYCYACASTFDVFDFCTSNNFVGKVQTICNRLGIDIKDVNFSKQNKSDANRIKQNPKQKKEKINTLPDGKLFDLSSIKPLTALQKKEIGDIQKDVLKYHKELTSINPKDLKLQQLAINYLKKRGITWSNIDDFKFGCKRHYIVFEKKECNCLVMPLNERSYTVRNLDECSHNGRYQNETLESFEKTIDLFKTFKEVKQNDIVFISEGLFDGISVYNTGIFKNVICLHGIAQKKNLFRFVEENRSKNITYVINLDEDERGLTLSKTYKDALRNAGINVIRSHIVELVKNAEPEARKYKDLNEMYLNFKDIFLGAVYYIKQEAEKERI